MPNRSVPAAATGLPISRSQLEHLIEDAIAMLDALDPDPDLEENGDLEPSIGTCHMGVVDAEEDKADDEPSLGSFNRMLNQENWSKTTSAAAWAGPDAELDDADREPNGDEGDFS